MTFLIDQYPLKKTKDLRSSMAEALAQYVSGLTFKTPASTEPPVSFAQVYDTWAEFQDRAMSAGGKLPAACVLPDRVEYEDARLTPSLDESTWFPAGQQGFGLWAVSELVAPFVIVVRARSIPERQAMVGTFEDAFVETGTPGTSRQRQVRYGKLVTMPSYYQRPVRLTLKAQQLLDSAKSASENRWMAQFEITAQARHYVIRPVTPMRSRVQLIETVEVTDVSQLPTDVPPGATVISS